VRLRRIAACAAAALALCGLAACGGGTKAGAAAFVGGTRITDADVNRYLTVQSTPYSNGQGQEIRPRVVVLQTLILQELLSKALAASGGPPSQSELDRVHDSVLQGATEEQLTSQITKSNFTASFEPVYLRTQELFAVLGERLHATSADEVIASVNKHDIGVQVSPRYGTWDTKQLGLQGEALAPGLSGVLTTGSTTSAPPSP
jgi:hypothetical protein